jgi:hypothetical protein
MGIGRDRMDWRLETARTASESALEPCASAALRDASFPKKPLDLALFTTGPAFPSSAPIRVNLWFKKTVLS